MKVGVVVLIRYACGGYDLQHLIQLGWGGRFKQVVITVLVLMVRTCHNLTSAAVPVLFTRQR